MSDAREELRRWLEFAREMGIEALPAPPLPLLPPQAASAAARLSAPPAKDVRAAASPEAMPPASPSPVEKMRQAITGGARPGAKTTPALAADVPPPVPAAAAPVASPAVAAPPPPLASVPGFGPLRRLETIPAELLVSPAGLCEPGAAAAPVGPLLTLDDIRAEIGDCQRCKLARARTNIVFGTGNPQAELMFVGEGPGRDEDAQGLPFVGKAGQLLNDIIKAIGMTREQVYIANVVKCRPPENRTPEPDEVAACRGFLFKQLSIVRPKVVVALGKPAAETLLQKAVAITAIRGQVIDFFGAKLVPTFHPAYLLRNPPKKREVWEDMKLVRDLLRAG